MAAAIGGSAEHGAQVEVLSLEDSARRLINECTNLDMATLTGAQLMATGKRHGGLISNCEDWEHKAVLAGRFSGDRRRG